MMIPSISYVMLFTRRSQNSLRATALRKVKGNPSLVLHPLSLLHLVQIKGKELSHILKCFEKMRRIQ